MDDRIDMLNAGIRGWENYYRMGKMKNILIRIDEYLKLGASEWMAKQAVGFGDHYQAVVKTTGLHLISKEVLARRGLLILPIGLSRRVPNGTYGGVRGATS